MLPFSYEDKLAELRDWDLWGPLVFGIVITLFIALASSHSQTEEVFGTIYIILFGGATIVGINAQMVGSEGSIFMMISILGYCLAPFVIASVVNYFLRKYIFMLGVSIVCGFSWFWAVKSASVFIAACCRRSRRALALYPIMLYYMFFAFFIALDD